MSKPQKVSLCASAFARGPFKAGGPIYHRATGWAAGYRAATKDMRRQIRLIEEEGFGASALFEVKKFINDTERLK